MKAAHFRLKRFEQWETSKGDSSHLVLLYHLFYFFHCKRCTLLRIINSKKTLINMSLSFNFDDKSIWLHRSKVNVTFLVIQGLWLSVITSSTIRTKTTKCARACANVARLSVRGLWLLIVALAPKLRFDVNLRSEIFFFIL